MTGVTSARVATHVPAIVEAVAALRAPRILIDGRSGSGKTTLASALAAAIDDAQLVRLDDFYPGWDGLASGSRIVVDSVLRERDPGWRSWDWQRDQAGTWHPLDAARPMIIEGCGALTADSRARADFAVWVELDAQTRKARALARDGDGYAPHWDRWAAQEETFMRRESPLTLADMIIDEREENALSSYRPQTGNVVSSTLEESCS